MPKPKSQKATKEPTLADAMQIIKRLEQATTDLRHDLNTLRDEVNDLDSKVVEKEYEGRGGKPDSDE